MSVKIMLAVIALLLVAVYCRLGVVLSNQRAIMRTLKINFQTLYERLR